MIGNYVDAGEFSVAVLFFPQRVRLRVVGRGSPRKQLEELLVFGRIKRLRYLCNAFSRRGLDLLRSQSGVPERNANGKIVIMDVEPFLDLRRGKPYLRTTHPHVADSDGVHVEHEQLAVVPNARFYQRPLLRVLNFHRNDSRAAFNELFQQRVENFCSVVNHVKLEKRLRRIYLLAKFAYLTQFLWLDVLSCVVVSAGISWDDELLELLDAV